MKQTTHLLRQAQFIGNQHPTPSEALRNVTLNCLNWLIWRGVLPPGSCNMHTMRSVNFPGRALIMRIMRRETDPPTLEYPVLKNPNPPDQPREAVVPAWRIPTSATAAGGGDRPTTW